MSVRFHRELHLAHHWLSLVDTMEGLSRQSRFTRQVYAASMLSAIKQQDLPGMREASRAFEAFYCSPAHGKWTALRDKTVIACERVKARV